METCLPQQETAFVRKSSKAYGFPRENATCDAKGPGRPASQSLVRGSTPPGTNPQQHAARLHHPRPEMSTETAAISTTAMGCYKIYKITSEESQGYQDLEQ